MGHRVRGDEEFMEPKHSRAGGAVDGMGGWTAKPAAELKVGDLTAGPVRNKACRESWRVTAVRQLADVVEARLKDRPWRGSILARFALGEALYVRERKA
jgi:hypothetical protein